MGIRHGLRPRGVPGSPLLGAGRAAGQLPLVAEQIVEVVVVPAGGMGGPCTLEPTGYGIDTLAAAEGILPAETLLLDRCALRFRSDIFGGVGCAVGLAEGVSAGDQRDGFLVVHGHAREGFTDIAGRSERIRLAVRSLRIHVDQAHLNGGEWILEVAVAAVTLVRQPLAFRTPVNIFGRLPDILAAAAETIG